MERSSGKGRNGLERERRMGGPREGVGGMILPLNSVPGPGSPNLATPSSPILATLHYFLLSRSSAAASQNPRLDMGQEFQPRVWIVLLVNIKVFPENCGSIKCKRAEMRQNVKDPIGVLASVGHSV